MPLTSLRVVLPGKGSLAPPATAVRFCLCSKLGASCPKDQLSTPYLFRRRALCYAPWLYRDF
jgi:hypothetical protein